jgi:hypothetical protein
MVLGDAFPTAVEVFSATFTTGGLRILTAFRAGEGPPLSAGWTPKVTQIFDRRLAENLRQLVEYLGVAQRYSRGLKVVPTYAADFALRKCGVIIKGQEGDDARPVPGGEAVPRSSPS